MEKVLTRSEEELMQVLWNIQSGFLKDILDATEEPRPHSNTIATLLKILVEKGFVGYETIGRNNHYRPLISRSAYGRKTAQKLVKGYFDGSAISLVSQFLKDDKLSIEEMELLLKEVKASRKK